jgi:hypothetical protein
MRFRALVYKELRECMPFMITVNILQFGFIFVVQLLDDSALEVILFWLAALSITLGLSLSVRQFNNEFTMKLWGVLLHRSVTRGTILISKLCSTLICFIPTLILWLINYYIYNKICFHEAPLVFWQGMIFIMFGYISYLVITLATLNPAKWYTTKLISIAFGLWMLIMLLLMIQWQLFGACLILIISASILLIQITDLFLNREFE